MLLRGEQPLGLLRLRLARFRGGQAALRRLARRQERVRVLYDVLGDYAPARSALRPRYLAALLRP